MPRSKALYVLVPAAIIAAASVMVGTNGAWNYFGDDGGLQYPLPLNAHRHIANWEKIIKPFDYVYYGPSDNSKKKIESNGFVATEQNTHWGGIGHTYIRLRQLDVPILLTSDSVLHMYSVQLAYVLQDLESGPLYRDLNSMSASMFAKSMEQRDLLADPRLMKAATRNAAYFAVGGALLNGDLPRGLPGTEAALAEAELDLIRAAKSPAMSPMFERYVDYSVFDPPGRYARSEDLGRYYRAMAWYGTEFRLWPVLGQPEGGVSMQPLQAVMISEALLGSADTKKAWERIDEVSSFYAGRHGGPGPQEYVAAYSAAPVAGYAGLLEERGVDALWGELARMPALASLGGCAAIGDPAGNALQHCPLESTAMRLMGQRLGPDPYAIPPLTGLEYTGSGEPFTLSQTDDGPVRGLPRGLDVMYVLGSDRAGQILQESGDADYRGYAERAGALRAEFYALAEEERPQSLYYGWLHALAALLEDPPNGYPTFMQGNAWQDKRLSTALASWAAMRHDSVLYDGFFYGTFYRYDNLVPVQIVPGYVEPELELYRRLHKLAGQMESKLQDLDLLKEDGSRITAVKSAMSRLVNITEKELQNVPLTPKENAYVNNFFYHIASPVQTGAKNNMPIDPYNNEIGAFDIVKDKYIAIVVGVNDDLGTGHVLEEATALNYVIAAYKHPDGRILAGVGPVYSYYEFRQPTDDMLTDDEWRSIVVESTPQRPAWAYSFASDRVIPNVPH